VAKIKQGDQSVHGEDANTAEDPETLKLPSDFKNELPKWECLECK